jgi:hypothetical protein
LCFSGSLLFVFPGFCFSRFSAVHASMLYLLLFFSASLLFCLSACLLICFSSSLLLCLTACLIKCFTSCRSNR